jgi:hypothetical protein
MDMKRILQALDGAAEKPATNDSDMKRFVSIVSESARPNNRLSQAEYIAVNHYTESETKKSITSPVLNVAEGAKPSMIGKYFKTVEQELEESADRKKEYAKQIADKAVGKIYEGIPRLSKHLKQSKIPRDSVTRSAKQSANKLLRKEEFDEADAIDTVTVDVPLLLRLLEYAKEDAKTDIDLHNVTEKLIALSKTEDTLSMDHYDSIVGDQLALPAPDEDQDGKEDY